MFVPSITTTIENIKLYIEQQTKLKVIIGFDDKDLAVPNVSLLGTVYITDANVKGYSMDLTLTALTEYSTTLAYSLLLDNRYTPDNYVPFNVISGRFNIKREGAITYVVEEININVSLEAFENNYNKIRAISI